jgi:archaellum component FlaC
MLNENPMNGTKTPCTCEPENKNITSDLGNINYALCEIESITEMMLSKIDGASPKEGSSAKEPSCISEVLEMMKARAERVYNRLNQVNSMI